MKRYYADNTCKNILRVVAFLLFAAIISAIWYYLRPIPILMTILIWVFAAVYIAVGAIWLPLFLRSLMYDISSEEIVVHSGVIFCNRVIMKTSAIRHVTIIRTPLSKTTGLNFVAVSALGGDALMLFLRHDNAEEIVRKLRQNIR